MATPQGLQAAVAGIHAKEGRLASERPAYLPHLPFLNRSAVQHTIHSMLKQAADPEERRKVLEFFTQGLLDPQIFSELDREKLPASFHNINDPLEAFMFYCRNAYRCLAPDFSRTIEQHLAERHPQKEGKGVAIIIDEADSTAKAAGRKPKELQRMIGDRDLLISLAAAAFRVTKDKQMGDGGSYFIFAPEGNEDVAVVEGVRFGLTVISLLKKYNELVEKKNDPAYRKCEVRVGIAATDPANRKDMILIQTEEREMRDKEGRPVLDAKGRPKLEVSGVINCHSMNEAGRLTGLAGKNKILLNRHAAKLIEPYFNLKRIEVGGELKEELALLTQKFNELSAKPEKTKEERLELYMSALMMQKLLELLANTFERANLPNDLLERHYSVLRSLPPSIFENSTGEHERNAIEGALGQFHGDKLPEAERKHLAELIGKWGFYTKQAIDFEAEVVRLERELELGADDLSAARSAVFHWSSQQKYRAYLGKKMTGLVAGDVSTLFEVEGYKTFRQDAISTPEEAPIRQKYIDGEENDGADKARCKAEELVISALAELNIPATFNYGLLALGSCLYTYQTTGAPNEGFARATRAVLLTLDALEQLQEGWGHQKDIFLARLQELLVARGVFSAEGEVNSDGLESYLRDCIIYPNALGKIGILKIIDTLAEAEGDSREQRKAMEEVSSFYGKPFNQIPNREVVEMMESIHQTSASFLREVNEAVGKGLFDGQLMTEGIADAAPPEGPIPVDTISVLERMVYRARDAGLGDPAAGSADLVFASQIGLLSGAIQAMAMPEKYKGEREDEWGIIASELRKLHIYPFLVRRFEVLFGV